MGEVKTHLRIKEILKEKNVTQNTLARLCEIPPSNMTGLVRGDRNPTLALLERVATALNVPLWQLIISPKEIYEGYTKVEKKKNNTNPNGNGGDLISGIIDQLIKQADSFEANNASIDIERNENWEIKISIKRKQR